MLKKIKTGIKKCCNQSPGWEEEGYRDFRNSPKRYMH